MVVEQQTFLGGCVTTLSTGTTLMQLYELGTTQGALAGTWNELL